MKESATLMSLSTSTWFQRRVSYKCTSFTQPRHYCTFEKIVLFFASKSLRRLHCTDSCHHQLIATCVAGNSDDISSLGRGTSFKLCYGRLREIRFMLYERKKDAIYATKISNLN